MGCCSIGIILPWRATNLLKGPDDGGVVRQALLAGTLVLVFHQIENLGCQREAGLHALVRILIDNRVVVRMPPRCRSQIHAECDRPPVGLRLVGAVRKAGVPVSTDDVCAQTSSGVFSALKREGSLPIRYAILVILQKIWDLRVLLYLPLLRGHVHRDKG